MPGTSPSGVAARRGLDSVGKPPVGVFLELHGGGFYMGSAAGSDIRNRRARGRAGYRSTDDDENRWQARELGEEGRDVGFGAIGRSPCVGVEKVLVGD